jgi:type I restriction enzyme S subunit
MEVREPSARYLRSTGYKQTEVGVIPEDWSLSSLSNLSAFITKGSTPTTYGFKWEQTGVLFLRSECVSEDGLDLSQSMFISGTAHASLRRSEVKDGDILVTITGNVGRAIVYRNADEANINQHIARVRVILPDASSKFVYHVLSQPSFRARFNTITTGQAYPQLSLKQIRDTKVPLPPTKAEQEAIAEALSDADALIESLAQLLAKKRQLKQGTMQQLLTGKKRLPGFGGEWEVKRLGDLGGFLKGSGVRKDQSMSGNLACIRYGEIYTRHSDYIRAFQSWISSDVAATATRLKYGDILFAGSGETKEEIGKCVAFVDRVEAYAGGDIVILRTEKADPLFLGYYLNTASINRQKASRGQGDAVVHIGASALAEVEGMFPSVPEQSAIAAILSDMDADIAALEEKLAKARNLKQGMMQELLTGRTRLV